MICSFKINHEAGPNRKDDIIFHFKTYLSKVVCNSLSDAETTEDPIFAEREAFDIFTLIEDEVFDVRSLNRLNEFIKFFIKQINEFM